MTDWFTWLVGVVALAAAAVIGWGVWSLVKLREFRVSEEKRNRIAQQIQQSRVGWWSDPKNPTKTKTDQSRVDGEC